MAVTIKDISRQATVSKVLNGEYSKVSMETSDRILKVADELNYCPNLGAFRTIREHKLKVPQDITLVGFDDVSLSSTMEPRLTTMKQPAYKNRRIRH